MKWPWVSDNFWMVARIERKWGFQSWTEFTLHYEVATSLWGLGIKCCPINVKCQETHVFDYLALRWWHCLGRFCNLLVQRLDEENSSFLVWTDVVASLPDVVASPALPLAFLFLTANLIQLRTSPSCRQGGELQGPPHCHAFPTIWALDPKPMVLSPWVMHGPFNKPLFQKKKKLH